MLESPSKEARIVALGLTSHIPRHLIHYAFGSVRVTHADLRPLGGLLPNLNELITAMDALEMRAVKMAVQPTQSAYIEDLREPLRRARVALARFYLSAHVAPRETGLACVTSADGGREFVRLTPPQPDASALELQCTESD